MKSIGSRSGLLRSMLLVSALSLLPFASGCATTQISHLNLDITTAPATFSALAYTGEILGYQVTRLAAAVNIRYDQETWIYYGLADHDYKMAIVVSHDVPDDQISARLAEAKAKGEEIWGRAMAIRQPPVPTPQAPPPGQPMPSAAPNPPRS